MTKNNLELVTSTSNDTFQQGLANVSVANSLNFRLLLGVVFTSQARLPSESWHLQECHRRIIMYNWICNHRFSTVKRRVCPVGTGWTSSWNAENCELVFFFFFFFFKKISLFYFRYRYTFPLHHVTLTYGCNKHIIIQRQFLILWQLLLYKWHSPNFHYCHISHRVSCPLFCGY